MVQRHEITEAGVYAAKTRHMVRHLHFLHDLLGLLPSTVVCRIDRDTLDPVEQIRAALV